VVEADVAQPEKREETGNLSETEAAVSGIPREEMAAGMLAKKGNYARGSDGFSDTDDSDRLTPERASGLRCAGEEEHFCFVVDRPGTRLRLPKNRSPQNISDDAPSSKFALFHKSCTD
jgi:hypothetical protein